MSDACARLHALVFKLPEVRWPFEQLALPRNGIYFFHETGEGWGHGDEYPRIVRIGTHREGNFRSRIADHFVVDERKMALDPNRAGPKDRSVFRKNIGRALLNRDHDPYLPRWEIDFTTRASRQAHNANRDIDKERCIEQEVSRLLRERFSFRWIIMEGQDKRMGSAGLESALIGTVSACRACRPSAMWLGRFSPKPKIVQSGLWLEQHLGDRGLSVEEIAALEIAIKRGGVL